MRGQQRHISGPGGKQTVTLTYLASKFDWQANYVGELSPDAKSMNLIAWLTMASGDDTSFEDASAYAIAGTLERQERETAMVLRAVRADVEIEQPSLFEATTDESDTARSQRIYRAGWFAAVMAQARVCTMADADDRHDWTLGYDAFHAALATYELTENKKRRRPATAG